MLFYDRRLLDIALDGLDEKRNLILEVGSGQGTDALLMSKTVNHIVAIDLSSNACKVAKLISKINGRENVSFVVGDAEHLPFRQDVFDVALCKDLLHHVSDPVRSISEMKRVAKRKGRVVAIEANPYNPQMALIGFIYYSVDKGVFKNTKTKLVSFFQNVGLFDLEIVNTEFFPRQMFFEYRSPFNKLVYLCGEKIIQILKRFEEVFQKTVFLKLFSNYLIIKGLKP
jgi:ubiquinone/menaquinone biosynthesis C-methylase UbiE